MLGRRVEQAKRSPTIDAVGLVSLVPPYDVFKYFFGTSAPATKLSLPTRHIW